mgnify:CR=1 FL=1
MPADIRLFSTDLDGTLLGNPDATWRFAEAWLALKRGLRPLLVYNTRRSVAATQALVAARRLPAPDYIIGALGVELHDSLYNRGDDLRPAGDPGWDLTAIERIVGGYAEARRLPGAAPHPFKSSWTWGRAREDDIRDLERRLASAGLRAQVSYACRHFLDVVPAWAGKGRTLARLCRRLQILPAGVLVAGDTANDTSAFQLPGVKGIVVRNALPEMLAPPADGGFFFAPSAMADGVLEGLRHFGVIREQPAGDAAPADETAWRLRFLRDCPGMNEPAAPGPVGGDRPAPGANPPAADAAGTPHP